MNLAEQHLGLSSLLHGHVGVGWAIEGRTWHWLIQRGPDVGLVLDSRLGWSLAPMARGEGLAKGLGVPAFCSFGLHSLFSHDRVMRMAAICTILLELSLKCLDSEKDHLVLAAKLLLLQGGSILEVVPIGPVLDGIGLVIAMVSDTSWNKPGLLLVHLMLLPSTLPAGCRIRRRWR